MLIQIQFVVSNKKIISSIWRLLTGIQDMSTLGKTFFEILEYSCNHNTCNITTTNGWFAKNISTTNAKCILD